MEYTFRIYREVYKEMISGRKTIEIRLLNDKTEKIKVGDIIRFNVLNSDKYLLVKVTDKKIYNDVEDLWNNKEILLNSSIYSNKEELTKVSSRIAQIKNHLNKNPYLKYCDE